MPTVLRERGWCFFFSSMSDLRIQRISCSDEALSVSFSDGRSLSVPMTFFPRLLGASASERADWSLIGRGLGVHWEALDEDVSVENILSAYSRSKAGQYAKVRTP